MLQQKTSKHDLLYEILKIDYEHTHLKKKDRVKYNRLDVNF